VGLFVLLGEARLGRWVPESLVAVGFEARGVLRVLGSASAQSAPFLLLIR